MLHTYRYRLSPSTTVELELERHVDICRQAYNHILYELNHSEEHLSRYQMQSMLPDMKEWWDGLSDVYSKVLQLVVKRVSDNLARLKDKKERGYPVGRLKWKGPQEYRSLTYNQVGFKLKNTSGQPVLSLSKIGEMPIRLHRPIPDDATLKQVTVKQQPTGEWFATFGVEMGRDPPEPPENPERCVGIDVGILKYTVDTDGLAVGSLDLSDERERLERAQRNLSRKEHGSANWEKQRQTVARREAGLKRKRRDFLHKLSTYYAREYDLVAVENLDTKGLVELPGNSRNRAEAAWGTFLRMLEYKCEREGTHLAAVESGGTTKECASCGVWTEKPLWVREHSCPACGFEAGRDENAAINILTRGLEAVGVGHSESTPVETGLPADTIVSAKRVVEPGSPPLKERTASAVSE